MNFKIGDTIYWIKYLEHKPVVQTLQVECIKETRKGYKLGDGRPGTVWVAAELAYLALEDAVEAAKMRHDNLAVIINE